MRRIYLIILAVLLTALLVGCQPTTPVTPQPSTRSPSITPAPTSTPAPGVTPTPTTKPSPTPTGPPARRGGTLNLSSIDPLTLDPALSSDGGSHQYILQIFGGLLALGDNLQPVPNIAQEWKVSPDGKTYTFTLRRDVKFQNGRQVTAADFKYSWERAANPATGSQTAGTYLGDIVGVKDMLAGTAKTLSGVTVVDDYTLQVQIDSPKSYFPFKVTYPTSFVVDKNNVATGSNWWRQPNGTGPFKLKQWVQNQSLTLVRNDQYYGQQANLDSVVYSFYGGIPMSLYETGDIDVVGVGSQDIYRVTDPATTFSRELVITPELSFSYTGFNTTKPPFDDANIRRAFSQAIDKDKMVSLIFAGMVQRADGVLPPGMPGFNSNLTGLKFDVDQAKQLIAASKYGSVDKLPPITLTTSGYGGGVGQDLQALVYQWRQNLGVDVKIRQLEPERLFYHLKDEKDEMFSMGWIADYPHPQDFVEILFRTGGDSNYGEYSNPAVDAILEKADTEPNSDQSLKLYQQAEQMLVDDAACIPLYFGKNYTLIKPYVKGYNQNPLGFVMLSKVSIEPH